LDIVFDVKIHTYFTGFVQKYRSAGKLTQVSYNEGHGKFSQDSITTA